MRASACARSRGRTRTIELAGAYVIVLMGLLVMLDINFFKRFYLLSNIHVRGEGKLGGLIIGLALGLVWVPCIGPFLSSILTMVGTSGQLISGVVLLAFYSLGLVIPMLAVAYSSHLLQKKLANILRHDAAFRHVSGGILVVFGLYQIVHGNIAF
jgi:cytochrome c-type biogenesis protein